jgi:hypothetical protein
MEIENIERMVDNKSEDSEQVRNEEEKSINEEEEESEKANEDIPQNIQINKVNEQISYQENKQKKYNEFPTKQSNQKPEIVDPFYTTSYILKYRRSKEELKELAIETNLPKSENCLFMLNIKILKSDISDGSPNPKMDIDDKEKDEFLVICCHEIAAIYFDEIYERIYTLNDLYKENKFFRVFEKIDEARGVIDESIKRNEKNSKKIFINFKDKELKLHMKLSFFDKEKEIILNIPKKILTDRDKNNLLPEFLKEIQDKMNHLKEENKKMKNRKAILEAKDPNLKNESEVKKENEPKPSLIEENLEIKDGNNNSEAKNQKKKVVKKKKIKKKNGKDSDKKAKSPEENFF